MLSYTVIVRSINPDLKGEPQRLVNPGERRSV